MKPFSTVKLIKLIFISAALFINSCTSSNQSIVTFNYGINLDTVKAQRFDTGKLWTFEYPPLEYFEKTYGFKPSEQWMEKVRKSALRFANYCSASFISEDGLIMTNDHCGRASITAVTKEGEDLQANSFFAENVNDERQVKNLYVDQLALIQDVTREIRDAIVPGEKDEEKILNEKINDIKEKYKKDTGLETEIVSLYNGAKYSLYGYKRYNDIRLVFSPETQMGFFGGDYDNFTYPRYNLDVNFFRVYDDSGKPLKTENYFKWSSDGINDEETVFIVGNPGRTHRLSTIAQLEYQRDIQYPTRLKLINGIIEINQEKIKEHPDQATKINDYLYAFTNSQKVYEGEIKALNDPYLMARKKDFEKKLRDAVDSDLELKKKYGDTWDKITEIRNEMRKYAGTINAYSFYPTIKSDYFNIAEQVIQLAEQLQLPEEQRQPQYRTALLDSTKASIFPDDLDKPINKIQLKVQIDFIIDNLGEENEIVQKLFGGRKGMEAVDYILGRSMLTSKESLNTFLENSPEQILNSDDPFIYFLMHTQKNLGELRYKAENLKQEEDIYSNKLGKAIFEVYGTSIPPDATFTLRIADGIVQDYDYNGTKAPIKTTFYGLYDRYYSFDEKFPWSLPDRWKNPPPEFKLSTPFNFISTNDAVGGSSGSPVINKNAEIVGIAFDGNIEGLSGDFIYDTKTNRSINVSSEGILECLKNMYRATRLSEELKKGKIPEKYLNKF
jgi:hypothetical protein